MTPIIRPLNISEEAQHCAELMAHSEPWITLGRTVPAALAILMDPGKETYVATDDRQILGFTVLDMRGLLRGYIQILCVDPSCRNQGIGTILMNWAEARIQRESPNVFVCVSSFNLGARRLYARLGYQVVGRLTDYSVPGHDEFLLRKTAGPWCHFHPKS